MEKSDTFAKSDLLDGVLLPIGPGEPSHLRSLTGYPGPVIWSEKTDGAPMGLLQKVIRAIWIYLDAYKSGEVTLPTAQKAILYAYTRLPIDPDYVYSRQRNHQILGEAMDYLADTTPRESGPSSRFPEDARVVAKAMFRDVQKHENLKSNKASAGDEQTVHARVAELMRSFGFDVTTSFVESSCGHKGKKSRVPRSSKKRGRR